MSMPHEQSCPAPTNGYARYVGRVGALAVGLGIGAAILASPAIAHAEDGASGARVQVRRVFGGDGYEPRSGVEEVRGQAPPEVAGPQLHVEGRPQGRRQALGRGHLVRHRRGQGREGAAQSIQAPSRRRLGGAVDPAVEAPGDRRRGTDRRWARFAAKPSVFRDRPRALRWCRVPRALIQVAAPSPLGTQQQLRAERLATRTSNTLPVALTKLLLRFGFRSAAAHHFAQVGGPDQGNLDQLAAAVDEYAMGAAFQQQILNSNDPTVVMQVAPPHTWYGMAVPGSRILYDNPDTIYRFMGVNAASSYVINGQFTGDRPADTSFSVLTGLTGNTASVLGGRDLVVDQNGSFTITVSRQAAMPGQPNHLQLTNGSTLIATRNTLSDWGTEVPMTLSIERTDGPRNSLFSQLGGFAIPGLGPLVVGSPLLTTLVSLIPPMAHPPLLLRGAVAAVIMALGIQRESTYMAVATTDPETGQQIPPNVLKDPTRNAEFLATQLQSAGYFQLADDEALVVTIDPGNAGYFVLPVTNDWTISKDYWNQQTSLNNSQAIANLDGTYTLVISKTDPGVANWVSTGGLNQGTISMRFQDLDPDSTDLPTVKTKLVRLDELSTAVPEDMVYYAAQQRAEQLVVRKAGFDTRFAPYPQP